MARIANLFPPIGEPGCACRMCLCVCAVNNPSNSQLTAIITAVVLVVLAIIIGVLVAKFK